MTTRTGRRTHVKSLVAFGALALAILIPAVTAAAEEGDGLSRARHATAEFRSVDEASADGYGLFKDVNGIACIDNPGVGGMGIHYVNATRVGDPGVNAATPEALVYRPLSNGHLRLVAVEYIVVQAAWVAAGNTERPELFGEPFELVSSPNRYGLPPFYELHAWIWKHNPSGIFNDWNPRVRCPAA